MTDTIDDFLKQKDIENALKVMKEYDPAAKLIWVDYLNEKNRYDEKYLNAEVWKQYTNDLFIRIMQLNEEFTTKQNRNPKSEYRKIFISYNAEDRLMLNKIVAYLKEHAIDFFVDHISMIPGENIKERVNKEILDREFIILLSKTSLTSTWVFTESSIANVKAQVTSGKVIPLAIDDVLFQDDYITSVIEKFSADLKQLNSDINKLYDFTNNAQHLETKRNTLVKFVNEYSSMIDIYRSAAVIRLYQDFDKGMENLIRTLRVQ